MSSLVTANRTKPSANQVLKHINNKLKKLKELTKKHATNREIQKKAREQEKK